MAIVTSTSLWGAASAVTATQVATAWAALSTGDTLYLDKNLNISGTASLPMDGRALTLSGDHTNSAGFYRTDADVKVADGVPYTLRFTGSGFLTIENLKFDGDDVPGTFTEYEYRFIGTMLSIEDKPDGFLVRNCSFTTDYATQIAVSDCDNWTISRCEFDGTVGYNTGRNPNGSATSAIEFGDSHNLTIEENYFHDIPTECLKVSVNNFSGKGIYLPIVRNNFGLRLKRDFLDTTGGYRGESAVNPALITGNIIVGVRGTFLDAKNLTWTYQTGLFPLTNVLFRFVEISGNQIFDSWNFMVFTLLDNQTLGGPTRLVTTAGDFFWEPYMPRDVEISGNDIQNLENYFNLHKNGIEIEATDNRVRGTGGTVSIQGATNAMRISDAVKTAYLAYEPKYTETGRTTPALLPVPTAPTFSYGPGAVAGEAIPEPFTVGMWTLTNPATSGDLTVDVLSLPTSSGSAISDLQYSINGGTNWTTLGGTTAQAYTIPGLVDGTEYSVIIRAVNATGPGLASDVKTDTPTAAASIPFAFTAGMWSIANEGSGGTATVTIDSLPANGGSAITHVEYKVGAGSWTSSGGTASFDITGLTNGVEVSVVIRAVNAVSADPDNASDAKTVTPSVLGIPGNTTLPVITVASGQLGDVGVQHTVDSGSWTNSPTSYVYGANIDGVFTAPGNTYTPVEADIGRELTWGVQARNDAGPSLYSDTLPVLIGRYVATIGQTLTLDVTVI